MSLNKFKTFFLYINIPLKYSLCHSMARPRLKHIWTSPLQVSNVETEGVPV